ATSLIERAAVTVKFGRFYLGALYDYYGGIAASPRFGTARDKGLIETETPRKRRPLRAPAPELVPISAKDGAELLLTHYSGGSKGPVILSHGIGGSSRMFMADSIQTNLLEYLVAQGYDVWLFDNRSSSMMPKSKAPRTAEDVALKDWPIAVA